MQWPVKEAQRIQTDGPVLFETGFGPSGLPHIGTFAEVARTTWVKNAYEQQTGRKTRLIAFSDDMDGLRAIPENMPNAEMLKKHLGKPLCHVPDPFGTHDSYSAHMNAKLQEFLARFGFEVEFVSSQTQYKSGVFDTGLKLVAEHHKAITAVIAPTLSEEKRKTWSPFLPICHNCKQINSTTVLEVAPSEDKASAYTVLYECNKTGGGGTPCYQVGRAPVTRGHVKVGWKVDWALRWLTYGVSYEMYGKDLIESAKLSGKICRILGGTPPVGMFYEMFLAEDGSKISKSLGNGITIDQWLNYAPLESLLLFCYQKPRKASRLSYNVVTQKTDEYLKNLRQFDRLSEEEQGESPLHYIHGGEVPGVYTPDLDFRTVLNLVKVVATDDIEVMKDYVGDAEGIGSRAESLLQNALDYHRDHGEEGIIVVPEGIQAEMTEEFLTWLIANPKASETEIQTEAYAIPKRRELNQREFFKTLYQLLLGQMNGPRLGILIAIYGTKATVTLARSRMD